MTTQMPASTPSTTPMPTLSDAAAKLSMPQRIERAAQFLAAALHTNVRDMLTLASLAAFRRAVSTPDGNVATVAETRAMLPAVASPATQPAPSASPVVIPIVTAPTTPPLTVAQLLAARRAALSVSTDGPGPDVPKPPPTVAELLAARRAALAPTTTGTVVVRADTPIPPFTGVAVATQVGVNVAPAGTGVGPMLARIQAARTASHAANHTTLSEQRIPVRPGFTSANTAPVAVSAAQVYDPVHERQLSITRNGKATATAKPATANPEANNGKPLNAVVCTACGNLTTNAAALCTGCNPRPRSDESGAVIATPGIRVARLTRGTQGTRSLSVAPRPASRNVAPTTMDVAPGLSRQAAIVSRDTVPMPAAVPMQPASVATPALKVQVELTAEFVAVIAACPDQATRNAVLANIQLMPGRDTAASAAYSALMAPSFTTKH